MSKVRYHLQKNQDLAWHSLCFYNEPSEARQEFRSRIIEYKSRHYPPAAARLVKEVWIRDTGDWVPAEVVDYQSFE